MATTSDYDAGLEADIEDDSVTEDYASSYASDTTSISSGSSALDYEYTNGRRYHGYRKGRYLLPNDEKEQDRLDLYHHLWNVQLGGRLTLAPVDPENLKQVLDLGTGTGIWCVDMGDEYPDAHITGTDLSPIQPKWVPPNVEFLVDDFEEEWTFPEGHFDLIHLRAMFGCIKDWKKVISEAYRCTAPGGYIEIQDIDLRFQKSDDGSLSPESGAVKFHSKWVEAITAIGLCVPIAEVEKYMQEVGYNNFQVSRYKFPISGWARDRNKKEVGRILSEICQAGFESYGLKLFTGVLGMETKEAQDMIDAACADAKNLKIHSYSDGYVVVAQKPLADTE